MASASDKSHSVATRFEQGEKSTEKQLATMQESIAESLKRELQPIRKSLQDLHLCQRQNKSLAAERDILLVELMKMLMSLCESKTQKAESPQAPDSDNARIEDLPTALQDRQSMLPSTEEQSQDDHEGSHKHSPLHASAASGTEEELEIYEPVEGLPDHIDDGVAQENPGSGTKYQEKPADPTAASDMLERDGRTGNYARCHVNAAWDVHLANHEPCDKPALKWVGHRAHDQWVSGDVDTPKKKRRRTDNIVR
ncbi:hypothetical protein IQ07DRAFT_686156 [Pyrenochaeta sp. DS3sAY3a]|nr:hypothetical protein IQ07DRAFT_686156 [Pyrenochaeta sp. DS3sAY3a]